MTFFSTPLKKCKTKAIDDLIFVYIRICGEIRAKLFGRVTEVNRNDEKK